MNAWGETALTILCGLMMFIGLLGMVIPVLPDLILIWGTALGYGLLVGWGSWGPWLFGGITVMALAGILADIWVGGIGAKVGRASGWGILGGLVAGGIGLLFFSLPGAVLGFLLGIFVVEYLRQSDVEKAGKATLGMGMGFGVAFVIKILLALGMIAAWIVWVIHN